LFSGKKNIEFLSLGLILISFM